MTDIRALREAAEKARSRNRMTGYTEFHVIANPTAIIALLDRLREAEEALALIKGETRGCSQDMGFDREIGPLGCALGDKCVCAPVHMIARAHLERHNNE